ncbi:LacI family DNA-binding transcriptional regulator [Streptomyces sp. NPDC005811]|uniref:LacI family DNA-binding transcriptional regulator n=1 Tax=Streptomyces sp. NPDC005811 TaxID=3154565 RepID=UPI0033D4A070
MPSTQDQNPGPADPSHRRRPTLTDVAAMAGVSVSTVSRALDGNPRIPAETRQKVLEAATALNFRRNISARSLRTQSSMLVGVVVPDIAIAFYATVLKAAQNVLEAAGYQVVVMNTERDAQREAAALRTLQARQVDGLLVATSGGYVPDRGPVVFFDHIIRDTGLGYVSPDNAGGMSTLVEHLAQVHGHTRIAFLGVPPGPTDRIQRLENAPATERLEAFRNVMGRLRLPVPPEYLAYGDYEWTEASAQRAVAELMRVEEPPTAIVAAGDTLALGALRQLRADQHEVGEEIALVSFDDPVSSDLLDPPMTALGRHDRELGEVGARMLLDALDAGKSGVAPKTAPRTETRVPLDLIVRRSCGCAPEALEAEQPP